MHRIQFHKEDVTLVNTALGLGENNPKLVKGSIVEFADRATAEECLRIYGDRARLLTEAEYKAETAPEAAADPVKGK